MSKGADGRGSIHRSPDGGWEGWVSFGVGPNGRRRRKHVRGKTKSSVAAKMAELERRREHGFVGGPSMTTSAWLAGWIEVRSSSVRPKTFEGYRVDQRWIDRAIGDVPLGKLAPEHVEWLYRSIVVAGAGLATVAHVRRTLSAALTTAVERGHLVRHPVRLAATPAYRPVEVEPLTVDEARRVLAVAATRRNAARWSVALALGLRQGEALGLRWADVDLEAHVLHVRRQLQWLPWRHGCSSIGESPTCHRDPGRCPARYGGGPVLVEPKSSAGRRAIALPTKIVDQLHSHCTAQGAERLLAASRWDPTWSLVFADSTGYPIRKHTDWDHWVSLLEAASVDRRRLHDARHTAGTLLLAQGVQPTVAMAILGHASAATLRRYSHVVDQMRAEAAEKMDRVLWR